MGILVTDSLSILASWRNHFSQQLNVHGVKYVRQTEIHTAEPLVPVLSASEVEMAIEKLKRHKSPSIDQIPAELIKASGMAIHYEIHKLINGIWKEEELPEQWKEVIMVPTYNTSQQDFGTRKVYCVSNVTFHAESKYAITIFPSPTVFVQWPF